MENFLFKTEKVSPSTTRIYNTTDVCSYLVEGKDRALLIDTGLGIGNIKEVVDGLTDLPYTVVLTHAHGDHVGCAALFDEVYLSPLDFCILEENEDPARKMAYAQQVRYEAVKQYTVEDYCPPRDKEYKPLYDGMEFDLGGITIQAVALPGHTPGMTCMLNKEERWLLTGDGCSQGVFLFLDEAVTVEEYREGLHVLKKVDGMYDRIFVSHTPWEAPLSLVEEVREVRDLIMEGKNDPEPFSFPIAGYDDIKQAMKTIDGNRRVDGKIGNIIYRESKIFKNK